MCARYTRQAAKAFGKVPIGISMLDTAAFLNDTVRYGNEMTVSKQCSFLFLFFPLLNKLDIKDSYVHDFTCPGEC